MTLRPDTEFIYSDDVVFNLGGFEVLNEGKDIAILAAGYMVHEANRAIELLDQKGVSASLIDLYSLPFDAEGVLDIIGAAGGNVITVEDNFDAFTLKQMHVKRIPKSARTPEELLKVCGLTSHDIAKTAMEMLGV